MSCFTSRRSGRVAQPGRDLVRGHYPPGDQAWNLPSVRTLIRQITDYINTWNADPKPFSWVATADETLAKVKVVETNVRKLIDTTPSKPRPITRY